MWVTLVVQVVVSFLRGVFAPLLPVVRRRAPDTNATMRVVGMKGDGNCLFRSLAYPSLQHQTVRSGVMAHLQSNWKYYKDFVADEQRATYRQDMAADGTWGDELMVRAFSDAANVDVFVFDAHTGKPISEYRQTKPSRTPKYLLYDGAHYDIIV